MTWPDLISVVSAFLTVVALVLALPQLMVARRQAREIQQIRLSLSTRYIGTFPKYLRDIVNFVEDAESEIIICSNFATSGFFSAHSTWRQYRNALEERQDANVSVEIILPDEAHRERLNEQDFAFSDEAWIQWKSNPAFQEGIKELIATTATTGSRVKIADLEKSTLIKLVEDNDKKALDTTFHRAKVVLTSFVSPLHFWIIDGRKAIFTIPFTAALGEPPLLGIRGYGFMTSDTDLIRALYHIRDRYKLGHQSIGPPG